MVTSERSHPEGGARHHSTGAGTTAQPWCPPGRSGRSPRLWSSQTTRRRPTMTTILVGTDTTAAADLAVEDAARMARERDADLVVLYVRSGKDLHSVVDPSRAADPD